MDVQNRVPLIQTTRDDRGLGGSGLESEMVDQRLRNAEKHKLNFETLKRQHIVLQEVSRSKPIAKLSTVNV